MFEWTQQAFSDNVQIVSVSGGTDICTGCKSCANLFLRIGTKAVMYIISRDCGTRSPHLRRRYVLYFQVKLCSLTHSWSEIQGKGLGMAVEIFDANGKNIEDTAQPGELVCTRPHPSMPVCFWGDKNDEKYRKAYFETYPGEIGLVISNVVAWNQLWHAGVWCHSDFIVKNPDTKGLIILGRRFAKTLLIFTSPLSNTILFRQ